jgi:hypothetical protein
LPTAVFTGNVQLPASGNPGNPALDNNGGTPPRKGEKGGIEDAAIFAIS